MISNLLKLTSRPTDGTSLGANVHEDLSQCTDCKKWVKLELISAVSASDGKFYLYFEVKNQWFEKITDVVISDGAANRLTVRTAQGGWGPSSAFYRVETDVDFSQAPSWTIDVDVERAGTPKGRWKFVKS
jgi:hypothetical protein